MNIKNTNNRCFFYCFAANLHPKPTQNSNFIKDFNLISETDPFIYERYINELVLGDDNEKISYPIDISDLEKLENFNPDLKVRLFELFQDPLNNTFNVSKRYDSDKTSSLPYLNLLLYEGHYCLIRDLQKIRQLSSENHRFLCKHCGQFGLTSLNALGVHEKTCQKRNKSQMFMVPDSVYFFIKIRNQSQALRLMNFIPRCQYLFL